MDGEEENVGPFRRTSARTRRMATRMASALASSDNRTQVVLRIGVSFPIPNPSNLSQH
jgi:zinc finger HIT domain-containing protein 1